MDGSSKLEFEEFVRLMILEKIDCFDNEVKTTNVKQKGWLSKAEFQNLYHKVGLEGAVVSLLDKFDGDKIFGDKIEEFRRQLRSEQTA